METVVKKGILLAAFGSGTLQGQRALALFGAEVERRFPGVPVRWAFTSALLRSRLARERKKADSARKALEKMLLEGFSHIAVQSLHAIPGEEWDQLREEIQQARNVRPEARVEIGAPLLASDADTNAAAQAIIRHLPEERRAGEPCILMGHGARHAAESAYVELAKRVSAEDPDVHIAVMRGSRTLEDILPLLSKASPSRVWLLPFFALVGTHTLRDMAGPQINSWRSRIEALGLPCTPVFKGLVEYSGFSALWFSHLDAAYERL